MRVENPAVTTHVSPEFPAGGWRTALACGPNGGNCVEVNLGAAGHVGVRDTKPAAREVLTFDTADWRAFVSGARHGRFAG